MALTREQVIANMRGANGLQPATPAPAKPTTTPTPVATPKPTTPAPTQSTPKTPNTSGGAWDRVNTPTQTPQPTQPTAPTQPRTTTPTQPTPTTQPRTAQPATPAQAPQTQEPKKTRDDGMTALDYQSNNQVRLNEIQDNLTRFSQTNPEMFRDRQTFENSFMYSSRSEDQKKILDNFFKNEQLKQGNPDFVFQTLMSGGSIDPKFQNSEGFRQGYEKYQKIGMFSAMDATQLARQMGKTIIVGSPEWQEIAKANPQLAQEALAEKKKTDMERMVNGTYVDYDGLDQARIKEVDVVVEALAKINEKLQSLDINIAEEYRKNVLENPVINDRFAKMEERSRKMAELQAVRDRSIDDAYASAGGAPDSVIRARANMTYRALNNQLMIMQQDQEIDQAMLNSDVQRYTGMYNAIIDEYNQNLSLTGIQAQNVMGIAETVSGAYREQRLQQEAEEQAQIQFERDMVMQQAKQEYEITKDEQAFARQIALADRKYEQDMAQLQYRTQADLQIQQMKQSGAGSTSMGAIVATSPMGNELLNTPDGTIIPSRLSQTTNPNGGKECGEFVNDIAGSRIFPNLLSDKLRVANEKDGAIGKAIVWKPSNDPTFNKYGHVGIIVGQNPDGSWQVKSSNLRGDGAVSTDTVPKNAALGYKTLPGVRQNITPDQQANIDKVKKEFSMIKNIIDSGDYETVSGLLQGRGPKNWAGGYRTRETMSSILQILNSQTLQGLIDAKNAGATFGALSNDELRLLQGQANSLGSLIRKNDKGEEVGFAISEGELKKRLKEILDGYDKISKEITGEPITKPPLPGGRNK